MPRKAYLAAPGGTREGVGDPSFAASLDSLTTLASMDEHKVGGRRVQQRSWESHSRPRRNVVVPSQKSKAFALQVKPKGKDKGKAKAKANIKRTVRNTGRARPGSARMGKKRPRPASRGSDSLQRLQAMRGQLLSSVSEMRGLRAGPEATRTAVMRLRRKKQSPTTADEAKRRPTSPPATPAAKSPEAAAAAVAGAAAVAARDAPANRVREREKTFFPPPSFGFDIFGKPKRTLDLRTWKLDAGSAHGLGRACANTAMAVLFPTTGVSEVECYVRLWPPFPH